MNEQPKNGVMFMLGQIDSKLDALSSGQERMWKSIGLNTDDIEMLKQVNAEHRGKIKVASIIWGAVSGLLVTAFDHIIFKK